MSVKRDTTHEMRANENEQKENANENEQKENAITRKRIRAL